MEQFLGVDPLDLLAGVVSSVYGTVAVLTCSAFVLSHIFKDEK